MRARDLLTALTTTTQQEYQGIYLSRKETLVPFTKIAQDASGNLILFFEPNRPPLSIKELYTSLMLHKNLPLLYWDGEERQKVYGFREEDRQIIL